MSGETVTRLRAGASPGVDRYGKPLPGVVTELDLGAFFDPGTSNEPVVIGGQPVVTTPTLYFLRSWPDLVPGDRVRVRGVVYDVDGRACEWRDPWGSGVGGSVVALKRAEGAVT